MDKYGSWFKEKEKTLLKDLFTFLSFPSISTDPAYKEGVLSCKDWLVAHMQSIGLQTEVWETANHPVVFGSYIGSAGPTLLFYGHYDVQPTAPLDKWDAPPFEPQVRSGAIYGRGAIDNKGQSFYTLAAIEAFIALAQRKKINIKVLIEGEEEIGSPGLAQLLPQKSQAVQADHIFIVDLDMYEEKIPAVTLGVRGVATINVLVENSSHDLHSGMYGGVVLNPARALAEVLGKIWDAEGRVQIPGFYEGIEELSEQELAIFDWSFDMRQQARKEGIKAFSGEGKFSLLESNWIRPTLEINGMTSGYTGRGYKSIIPASAMVKLSCRLVPRQDPEKVIRAVQTFWESHLPSELLLSFEKGVGTAGMRTSSHSQAVQGALQAYEKIYRTKCRIKLCGATIPIAGPLADACGGDIVFMGVGLGSDQMHAPNEHFGLDRLKEGFLSITQVLEYFSLAREGE